MKTYGQIDFEGRNERAIELLGNDKLWPVWEELSESSQAISEAGAQAVIEEFKRRNGIVIQPGED